MGGTEPKDAPNCLRCRYFYVTWDYSFPRGCRVFGIKSRDMPSLVVLRNTGHNCPVFEASPRLKKRKRR
jgi:hypothetical protein